MDMVVYAEKWEGGGEKAAQWMVDVTLNDLILRGMVMALVEAVGVPTQMTSSRGAVAAEGGTVRPEFDAVRT